MRVLVGMSGGVDSTTSVLLLKEAGYEVVGITFKFTEDFDYSDAVKMAKALNIEHHVVDYRSEFKSEVIDKFINDYTNGLTPNPCIHCNRVCKFKFLFDNMKKYNCDMIATGHYANLKDGLLYRGEDKLKDQSYFLYNLDKDKLDKIIFPLNGLTKDKVREIASSNNIIIPKSKESFDVCFITDSFKKYMKDHSNEKIGDIIDIDTSKVIGKHDGLNNYTIGQRKGLNVGGSTDRMFVVGKDITNNILYVCIGDDNSHLYSDSCLITDVNLLVDDIPSLCTAKFRYRQTDVDVSVEKIDDNNMLVKYDNLRAITPGQACVFYNGDLCLGGGIIKEIYKNDKKVMYV